MPRNPQGRMVETPDRWANAAQRIARQYPGFTPGSTGQSALYEQRALGMQQQARDVAIEGLRRAQARDAPEGSEGDPLWTMLSGANEAMLNIYKRREEARSLARVGKDPYALKSAVMSMGSPMAGFMEGLYRNDAVTGIADQSYRPKNVRVFAGPSPEGSNQMRGESVQPQGWNARSTMFAPGQKSALTGRTYEQEQARSNPAMAGLQRQAPRTAVEDVQRRGPAARPYRR